MTNKFTLKRLPVRLIYTVKVTNYLTEVGKTGPEAVFTLKDGSTITVLFTCI
jgi:hypothetical protein